MKSFGKPYDLRKLSNVVTKPFEDKIMINLFFTTKLFDLNSEDNISKIFYLEPLLTDYFFSYLEVFLNKVNIPLSFNNNNNNKKLQ